MWSVLVITHHTESFTQTHKRCLNDLIFVNPLLSEEKKKLVRGFDERHGEAQELVSKVTHAHDK